MKFYAHRTRNAAGEITAVLNIVQPRRACLYLAATAEGVRIVHGGALLQPKQLQQFCVGVRTAGELSVRLRSGEQLEELPEDRHE